MVRVRSRQLRAGFAVAAIFLLASPQGPPAVAASLCESVQQACLSDEAQDDRPAVLAPAVWSVIGPPVIPVKGTDGRVHLAYEILFTNVVADAVRVVSVEMIDPDEDDVPVGEDSVFALDGTDVTSQLRIFSAEITLDGANYSALLPPGQSGLMYVDLSFEDRSDIPRRLAHRVSLSQELGSEPGVTTVGGFAEISSTEAVVVRPPLRGGGWFNANGCCAIIDPHRFFVLPLNGSFWPAERFAIDFVQLDEQGRLPDAGENLHSWHHYGTDILAAAQGRVVEVVDGLPDQVPGQESPGLTIDELGGNHVIIDMGEGRFALYAHMIPGSIVVEKGQFVRAGEKLGHLGNSGSSTEPHLHFHIMDRPHPLKSVGLPFVFDRMTFEGHVVGTLIDLSGKPPIDDSERGHRNRQMPLALDVVGFR
jgi:Peptidase family M23